MKHEELLGIKNYQDIVKCYADESDRGAAVLAGSYVDGFIEKYLRSFMRQDKGINKLFKGGGLSRFYTKIETGWSLKYINNRAKKDLHCIREVRNHFAHYPAITTFEDPVVRDMCKKLSTAEIKDVDESTIDTRTQYLFACGLAVAQMHNTMWEIESKKDPQKKDTSRSRIVSVLKGGLKVYKILCECRLGGGLGEFCELTGKSGFFFNHFLLESKHSGRSKTFILFSLNHILQFSGSVPISLPYSLSRHFDGHILFCPVLLSNNLRK